MSKTQKLAAFVTTIVVILVLILISREGGQSTPEFVPNDFLLGEAQESFKVTEIPPLPEAEREADIARLVVELGASEKGEEEAVTPGVPLAVTVKSAEEELSPPQPRTYVVAAGDTFIGIAEKVYGDKTRWQEIFEANRKQVSDPSRLAVGQRLIIPSVVKSELKAEKSLLPSVGSLSHVVQRGDTLYKLAEKYYGDGSHWEDIHAANRKAIPNPNRLELGQRLVIPARSGASAD